MFRFPVLATVFFMSAIAWEPCVEGTMSEVTFRRLAIRKVMPVFPEEATRANAQGVTVAKVRLDEKSEISSVEILQAPHGSIATSDC